MALTVSAALATSLVVLTGPMALAGESVAAGVTAEADAGRPAPLEVSPSGSDTARGGDLITLSRPVTVRTTRTLTSAWSTVRITASSAIPDSLTGSVLLSVASSSAKRSGSVQIRPTGAPGTGTLALSHSTRAVSNLTLVKLGTGGSIQIRGGSAAPRVSVRVIGWVPTTAALSVPERAISLPALTVKGSARTVRVAGTRGVPDGVTSVVLGIRTSHARSGSLALWTRGASTPSRGIAFTSSTQTSFSVVRPDSSGSVSLRALRGQASVSLQILGWSSGATTLKAPSKPTGPRVKSTSKSYLTVAGASGISSSARAVAVTINAPKGWRVKVWSTTSTRSPILLSTVSTGTAVQVWVRVPSNKKVAFQAKAPTRTRATATVMLGGYVDSTGSQVLSVSPKPDTRMLSSGDIVAQHDGGVVDLAASSGGAQVGDYLFIRPATGASYLGQVTSAEARPGGVTRVALRNVDSMSEAFTEFDAQFTGAVQDSQQLAPNLVSTLEGGPTGVAGAAGPGSIGLSFLESKHWNCSVGVDPSQLISVRVAYEGDVNLDMSLSERSIDFSAKGAFSITFSFLGGSSVSCSVSGDLPFHPPLGATGLALNFGGEGQVQVTNPSNDDGGAFSITGGIRAYVGFYYIAGEDGGASTANPFAVFRGSDERETTGQFSLGIVLGVGPAPVPGLSRAVEASVGITIGVTFAVANPDPADDPYHRTLRGARCIDLNASWFVKVGAQAAIALAPDLNLEIPIKESDPVRLYAGPCYGYTGTITFEANISDIPSGCTAEYCPVTDTFVRTLTRTLVGTAADFGRFSSPIYGAWGAPISHPYTWTYSRDDQLSWTHDPCWAGLGCGDVLCQTSITAVGSGMVGWNPDDPTASWFLDGYDSPNFIQSDGLPSDQVVSQASTVLSGDPRYCGESRTDPVSTDIRPTYYQETVDPLLLRRKNINLTLTGQWDQWHPELTFTTTVNLTRHEYPR